MSYRSLPGPATRVRINAVSPFSVVVSKKCNAFNVHNGSISVRDRAFPCCQSIHQKSTPSSSSGWCTRCKTALTNVRLFKSNNTGRVEAGSIPTAFATAVYWASDGRIPAAGCTLSESRLPVACSVCNNLTGSGNKVRFQVYPVHPLPYYSGMSELCQFISSTATDMCMPDFVKRSIKSR